MPLGLSGTLRIVEGEEVMLRGLRYGEFSHLLKNQTFNSRYMFIYEVGKLGIISVLSLSDDNGRVEYDKEIHYDEMFNSFFEFVSMCTDIIIEMTLLTDEERRIIKDQCYFADYLHENPRAETAWDCRKCVETRMIMKRTCPRFGEEEIEKMKAMPKYIPEALLEEGEEQNLEEMPTAPVAPKRKRMSAAEQLAMQREAKAAAESVNYVKEEYTLRTDMHLWKECPVYIESSTLRLDMQAAYRCLGAESLLVSGGIIDQPNRYMEMTSFIKSIQNEIQEKRYDKKAKSASMEKQKRQESEPKTKSLGSR